MADDPAAYTAQYNHDTYLAKKQYWPHNLDVGWDDDHAKTLESVADGGKIFPLIPVNSRCDEIRHQNDLQMPKPDSRLQHTEEMLSDNPVTQMNRLSLNKSGTVLQGIKRAASSDVESSPDPLSSNTPSLDASGPVPSSKCLKRSAYGVASPLSQYTKGHNIDSTLRRPVHSTNLHPELKFSRRPGSPIRQVKCRTMQTATVERRAVNQHQTFSCSEFKGPPPGEARYSGIFLQPETRPITSEQLAVEVKNIYSDLVAVEAKCISLDNAELASDRNYIDTHECEKWQALIALHRTLLYEHHDFLSASQHPAANEPLTRLALKYSMPARMWKHAIHSFLEVLRRRLPDSMDYMLQFIYTAYQMIALLYETIEPFKATWIECLGDLARYRMAIEDGVQKDRETWGVVARSWYSVASDMNSHIGRLYHHLGILARPDAVRQLSFYCRALTCVQPFPNARESLLTLLIPAIEAHNTGRAFPYIHELDAMLLYLHAAMLIGSGSDENLRCTREDYLGVYRRYISRIGEQMNGPNGRWKDHGVSIAIANISACLAYGNTKSGNPLALAFDSGVDQTPGTTITLSHDDIQEGFIRPANLLFSIFAAALHRKADVTVLPHVHVILVFIRSVSLLVATAAPLIKAFLHQVPWTKLVDFLNSFPLIELVGTSMEEQSVSKGSLVGSKADGGPLPEDYSLRGEVWTRNYFSDHWFDSSPDEDTRYLEHASTDSTRMQRVLLLGMCISKIGYVGFDSQRKCFLDPLPAKVSQKVQDPVEKKPFYDKAWKNEG